MNKSKLKMVLLIMISILLCFSLSSAEDNPVIFKTDYEPPTKFLISCGDGSVIISFETGEAVFENCTPNEAAKVLYEAFQYYFEEQKAKWCEEQNKQ